MYDYAETRRRCGGYASYTGHCGALDCDTCYPSSEDEDEQESTTSRVVTARKARPGKGWVLEIRVGDRVRVTSGFTYKPGGRLGYLPKRYTRVTKGPAWDEASTVH